MTGTVANPHARVIEEMLRGYRMTQMLHVIAKLGIPDRLVNGSRTAAELAALTSADANALYRLMRALASIGIFSEDSQGRFELTEVGGSLRSDAPDSAREAAILYGESWWWSAWGNLYHAVRSGQTAFERAHGTSLFSYLRDKPADATLFQNCMARMTVQQAAEIAKACDLSAARTLVDIGGGYGVLIAAMLERNPQLSAILFDRPEIIEAARERVSALNIAERCRLVAGDFFVAVPSGGDCYVLKDIVHDWDDERAGVILRQVYRAMNDNGRLLLVERVILPGNHYSPGKLVDISMLVLTGGKERNQSEYRGLLSSAGFAIDHVTEVNSETMAIVARPAPTTVPT